MHLRETASLHKGHLLLLWGAMRPKRPDVLDFHRLLYALRIDFASKRKRTHCHSDNFRITISLLKSCSMFHFNFYFVCSLLNFFGRAECYSKRHGMLWDTFRRPLFFPSTFSSRNTRRSNPPHHQVQYILPFSCLDIWKKTKVQARHSPRSSSVQ
jgi:hypothetical protein